MLDIYYLGFGFFETKMAFFLEFYNCQLDYFGRKGQQVSLNDDKVVCILFHVALGHLFERGFCAF